MFFTASATADLRINLSPKGSDCLRVLDRQTVVYLDQTGSGNETAAHIRADGRLTIMFCAFDGAPMILRLYGRGRVLPRGTEAYAALLASAFGGDEPPGARQIIAMDVESVQTSCGFSVPVMAFQEERETLKILPAARATTASAPTGWSTMSRRSTGFRREWPRRWRRRSSDRRPRVLREGLAARTKHVRPAVRCIGGWHPQPER